MSLSPPAECSRHEVQQPRTRSPTVERLTDGTIRRLVPPERNVRRPGRLATATERHRRQPRRGCQGHIPQYFGWAGRQREYPPFDPQYYYVLSDIADQYWLPSVRLASSRFHSAIRRHPFASIPSHTPPHSVFRRPTLNSR